VSGALALTLLRLALAPVVVGVALLRGPGAAIAALLVVGFLSDVLDGVVARRTGKATAALRRLDSTVDTIFYLAIAVAGWLLFRDVLRPALPWIAAVICTEILTNAACWLRFRREASYHSFSAKIFGVALFLALLALFVAGSAALIVPAVMIGLFSHAENLAVTAVLPEWRHDVRSLAAALRIRRSVAASL
jgi:CDP-diacylglycerol--glycerol-3-phosphate 3-phosphatidyltransferase